MVTRVRADLPRSVATLAAQLAALPGVEAVVLGGSRATGTARPDSNWDLGLYARGRVDADAIRALGHPGYVSEPGEWGPLINGGAWLTVDGVAVDVLYRDLDVVERRVADANAGRFAILDQNGYAVGAPTYMSVGELAVAEPIHGRLPRPAFPDALAASAPARWEGRAGVSLFFAETHTDPIARTAMLANAVLSAAHARLAARREWVFNEKRLVERAGLQAAAPLVARDDPAGVATLLGVAPLRPR
jgi:predicted nucleotidyltransferase